MWLEHVTDAEHNEHQVFSMVGARIQLSTSASLVRTRPQEFLIHETPRVARQHPHDNASTDCAQIFPQAMQATPSP